MIRTVMVSGGFDPIHKGHLDLLKAAALIERGGNRVLVALNSDAWLIRKKGFRCLPWDHRAAILDAMVIGPSNHHRPTVIQVDDSDGTVCAALREHKPDVFANGGDRFEHNVPEAGLCEVLDITAVYGIGGGKIASSSAFAGPPREHVRREWGYYETVYRLGGFAVKRLLFKHNGETSRQRHMLRSEHYVVVKGHLRLELEDKIRSLLPNQSAYVEAGAWHKLIALRPETQVIEVQVGDPREDDIERREP